MWRGQQPSHLQLAFGKAQKEINKRGRRKVCRSKDIKDGITFLQTFHILSEQFRPPWLHREANWRTASMPFIILQSKPHLLFNIRKYWPSYKLASLRVQGRPGIAVTLFRYLVPGVLISPQSDQEGKNLGSMSGTRAISTTSRHELSSSFLFPARQGAEGKSRHSDRNISLFPSWSG